RGALAIGVADEPHRGPEGTGPAFQPAAPRAVADHRELGAGMARENARHRGENGPEIVARLDPPEPEEPWCPVRRPRAVRVKEGRVDAVRHDLPRRVE